MQKISLILRNSKLLLMRLLREYALNSSFDDFDEWGTVTNSCESLPETFKWDPKIPSKLEVNNYFNFEGKINGTDKNLECDESCILIELMYRNYFTVLC